MYTYFTKYEIYFRNMEAGEKNLKMWKERKKVKNVIKNALS